MYIKIYLSVEKNVFMNNFNNEMVIKYMNMNIHDKDIKQMMR